MVKVAQVQISFWDKPHGYLVGDLILELGDLVVVKTAWGNDIGKVILIKEMKEDDLAANSVLDNIIRKATTEDIENFNEIQKQSSQALEYCKRTVERQDLPMKIIDAHFSFDGGKVVFPFIADSRVDFRQLVKDLTHHFQKSIRLQQIGIRDEAKITGDFGSCGRLLCCKTHLSGLESITSDLADMQQVAHRGSERLSGLCGRLRCCLAFEGSTYRELMSKMPEIGKVVKTTKGRGKVIGRHILKQTVDVAMEGDSSNVLELSLSDIKK